MHKHVMQMKRAKQRGFIGGGVGLERAGEGKTMLTAMPVDVSLAHVGNDMH
jgi:hypothetical protein